MSFQIHPNDLPAFMQQQIDDNIGYLYLLPAVILMGVFIIYSMILNVQISMTDWSGLSEKHFIAFANYVKLFRDKAFWDSLGVQLIWMLLSTVFHALGGLILSIIVEYFIHRKLQAVFRTLFFMPMMMSLVAVGILWTLIYNPLIGVINEILQVLGILSGNQTLDLLGDRSTALLAAFIPALWQWSGFGMVVFSAALQGMSRELLRRHRSTAAANGSRSAISSSPCCA
ncbi:MAG: carbohydrate ABC transporter permease [Acutalibacteraceae bacterium]